MDIQFFRFPKSLPNEDFHKHNEEVTELWKHFQTNTHSRVPVRFNTNPRILLLDPAYNTSQISFQQYFEDPETMAHVQLEWQFWLRHFLPGDHTKGIPDEWTVNIDFQNTYDAAWFGCPVVYRQDQVPDTLPILAEENKNMLFDKGIPDPFGGAWAQRALQFLEYFQSKAEKGWYFLGRPVRFGGYVPFLNSDGIFTIAASLRGASMLCLDIAMDPSYVEQLLDLICEALILRIKAWRKLLQLPETLDGMWAADDAIELLSTETYQELVLPRHIRYYDALSSPKNRGMHLCGDAQRHFKIIHEVLQVTQFDTGFPIDFARLRFELGPNVLISGGPPAYMFLEPNPRIIAEETRRILRSGILEGRQFILQEGNNLPPCARLENCETVYRIACQEGKFV